MHIDMSRLYISSVQLFMIAVEFHVSSFLYKRKRHIILMITVPVESM